MPNMRVIVMLVDVLMLLNHASAVYSKHGDVCYPLQSQLNKRAGMFVARQLNDAHYITDELPHNNNNDNDDDDDNNNNETPLLAPVPDPARRAVVYNTFGADIDGQHAAMTVAGVIDALFVVHRQLIGKALTMVLDVKDGRASGAVRLVRDDELNDEHWIVPKDKVVVTNQCGVFDPDRPLLPMTSGIDASQGVQRSFEWPDVECADDDVVLHVLVYINGIIALQRRHQLPLQQTLSAIDVLRKELTASSRAQVATLKKELDELKRRADDIDARNATEPEDELKRLADAAAQHNAIVALQSKLDAAIGVQTHLIVALAAEKKQQAVS
jgi:hypothetical protein